jgi:mRNA interferase MazF
MIYIPDRGDIVWLEFDPQSDKEQKGKRPGIIVSGKEYNRKTGLALICPITSKSKNYPFEVKLAGKINGVILSDQIKSIDWKSRNIVFIEKTKTMITNEVSENIGLLIF